MICKTFEIFLFSIIELSKLSLSYLMLIKFRIFAKVFFVSYWLLISIWTSYFFRNVLRKIACEICWSFSWLWVSMFIFLNVHIYFSNFAIAIKEHWIRLKKMFRFSVFVLFFIFSSLIHWRYIVVFSFFLLILKFLKFTTYFWVLMN